MSTRESHTGAHVNSLAPHYAPDAKHYRRDSIHLAGLIPPGPVTRSHSLGARNESASITQSLIDVAAVTFWFLFIALVGVSITAAILILMFVVSF